MLTQLQSAEGAVASLLVFGSFLGLDTSVSLIFFRFCQFHVTGLVRFDLTSVCVFAMYVIYAGQSQGAVWPPDVLE